MKLADKVKYTSMKPNLNSLRKIFLISLILFITVKLSSQTYTFTSAGATGTAGPSVSQVTLAYNSTNLAGAVSVSLGVQTWTVPTTGLYRITAYGARGGDSRASTYTGGAGAQIAGDFSLTAGSVIKVLVGQMGTSGFGSSYYMGGGGGGGFLCYT